MHRICQFFGGWQTGGDSSEVRRQKSGDRSQGSGKKGLFADVNQGLFIVHKKDSLAAHGSGRDGLSFLFFSCF